MRLNELKPSEGSTRNRRRVGRGPGSGRGKTCGRGENGYRSRSGSRVKTYFEGGQTPLSRRVPKKGFRNRFGTRYQIVNVGDVERIDAQGKDIDAQVLRASGLIHSADRPVKILGGGEVSKPVSVKVAAYSKSAREKLKMPKAKAR